MSILTSPEYVSAGSRMTWTGQFQNILLWGSVTPNDAIQQVVSYLSNNYQLAVEKIDNGLSLGGVGSGSITFHLKTNIDRGDGETDDGLTDILGNINDAFGKFAIAPQTSVINNYVPADTSNRGTVDTGAGLKTVPEQAADSPSSSGSWWDSLVGKVEAGSIGFTIGAIAVVALIIVVAVKSEV